jgi:hypothetical protein
LAKQTNGYIWRISFKALKRDQIKKTVKYYAEKRYEKFGE